MLDHFVSPQRLSLEKWQSTTLGREGHSNKGVFYALDPSFSRDLSRGGLHRRHGPELHFNDAMGAPLMLDEIVTIQGVVTAPTGVFNASRTEVFIQDDTGGMNLFSFNPVYPDDYDLGDEVKVTGTIIVFNGLTELEPITVELIGKDRPQPTPLLLTCAELRDSYDFATNSEPTESLLIRLNGVTWDPGNYALMDSTGTAMMYIDPDTGIPWPEGEFNVVGVMKQYDDAGEEGPWYLGYEVLPRFISDITYGSGPQFVNYPVQTDVAMGGATITWTTDIACETVLEYGTTTGFEMESIRLGNSTTNHQVVLTGLSSATIYYCSAVAAEGADSINSPSITIISPSESSSGQIDVYFSQSVDTSYSTGVNALSTDISQRMVDLIDAATTSIDFCFFAFTHDDVADALVDAHGRGVDVQVIYEEFDPVINVLIVAGIDVVTDPDEEHANTHNKFAVFDARDGDESNDVVWTGSWNASYNGTHENAENVVVVHDAALATTYTIEFDEMWGGTFSTEKADNTPHLFLIGGRNVEQYMSPSDGMAAVMTNLIGTADTDLLFAIYSFTDTVITNALTSRFNAGVAVRGVFDSEGAEYEYSQSQPLADLGVDVVLDNVEQGGDDQLMHHKYLLTDPLPGGSDPAVVTGSYNWTYTAKTYKDENILIIHDATITNIFFQEWMARYHEGGGTWDYDVPVELAADFTWDPTSPAIGEEVTFTDTSTGTPSGWTWDFGDGVGTSTDQNPTYTYDTDGTYTVGLTATNDTGSDTKTLDVTVSDSTVFTCTNIAVAAVG
ncbi:MAG: PKD domain-containing protein, partial [Thermoanaerobaculales bacterium]|nr:PKD domain-containing protein [Thermoanaerobaculales bacterium]